MHRELAGELGHLLGWQYVTNVLHTARFSYVETRGGGYSQTNWVGVCGPLPKTLTLFMTKICDFPNPIYDLTKKLIPYLWPDPYINTLFQTCLIIISLVQTSVKGNVYLLLLGRLQDCMCKEVASSKKNEFKTRVQKSAPYLWPQWRKNGYNRYPIYDQNGWKTIPFGAAHTYIAHIREYPPGCRKRPVKSKKHCKSGARPSSRGGGRSFPYMAYTGTCRWTGYGFWPPLPWTWYTILWEPVLDRVSTCPKQGMFFLNLFKKSFSKNYFKKIVQL